MNSTSEAGRNVLAPSIFLFGCNLRCPFCMNGRIVIKREEHIKNPVKTIEIESVLKYCEDNKSEWIMISGGEPFYINPEKFENLINLLKDNGLKVGVSTNGTYPEKLKYFLKDIDYITMDFKSPNRKDYYILDAEKKSQEIEAMDRMLESLDILRYHKKNNLGFDYEIRTTLYPQYIKDFSDLEKIGDYINKDELWVIQPYRHARNMLYEEIALRFPEYTFEECKDFLEVAKRFSIDAYIRYV